MPDAPFRPSAAHAQHLAELAAQHNASLPSTHHVTYEQVLSAYRTGARTAPLTSDISAAALRAATEFTQTVRRTADPASTTPGTDTELTARLDPEASYATPEHALFAICEFSGLGYETLPAFRAAWLRAVRDYEPPFARAAALAIDPENSRDRDLLPTHEQEGTAK